jgi:hypothetical protein
MRQVLLGDVVAAARSVLELSPPERAAAVSKMIDNAHIADKVMKRTGLPHKTWGNGSLMAAALPKPKGTEPFLSDLDYLAAIRLILEALAVWKQNQRQSIRRHGA